MATRPRTRGMTTATGRPLTSRMRTAQVPGTSAGHQAAILPSHHTNIKVSNRPVTGAGGLAGMKSSSPSSESLLLGRQVADANYYLVLLRQRHKDIADEMNRLRNETERMTSESRQYGQLERTFEERLDKVRELEGTLADYNLAADKLRNGVDPDEIEQFRQELEGKNKDMESDIDQVFLAKQSVERECLSLERDIANMYKAVEDMFHEHNDVEKVRAYQNYIARTRDLHLLGRTREREMEALRRQIYEVEGSVRKSPVTDLFDKECENRDILKDKIDKLKDDIDIASMDPKEAHAVLLGRVKGHQRKATELDAKAAELDKEIETLKAQQREINDTIAVALSAEQSNLGDVQDDGDINDKYQQTLEKDAEITSFLETVDDAISSIVQEQNNTKSSIVALLEHISKGIVASEEELPSRDFFEEMKDETNFKTKHLETSQQTILMLNKQKAKRMQELEQIDTLEDKITLELQQLSQKEETLKNEVKHYSDTTSLRSRAERTEDYLSTMIERYAHAIEETQARTKAVSSKLDEHRRALRQSRETGQVLGEWEQKLRFQGQTIFTLEEFIAKRGRETDFESLKLNCAGLVDQLNTMVVESM